MGIPLVSAKEGVTKAPQKIKRENKKLRNYKIKDDDPQLIFNWTQ